MKTILLLLLCYLIGSISGAYIIGKWHLHADIRDYGSGNAGTTNAIRVMGKKPGYLTFAIDVAKGMVAMLLIAPMLDESIRLLACLFVVLGHDFPFYLKFRGGKGIATTLGALGALRPLFLVPSILAGYLVGMKTRYVSVGSLTFITIMSLLMFFFYADSAANRWAIALVWILGFIRHKDNVKRLREGTENKMGG
ncbi:MAG: glycerol-3-phosphate 1-O-acyltransferase PlsY [Peptoniphilus sp.]|nr:glycerol-3-phosphate 1-O-acyltransferase PlsY [Peptoniphilus sp.]MDD7363742.1 glycerol-3-phosphate 1-O-acyltransferase PlsY [Bacillota bacterium]MDY6044127.1 glycerol-3-phosphate 1-O-acyltransferase PlsY [Peptoniphilus sp.]